MRSKEYIKNNPYRVLGVATTDSPATMVSRASRMKAFAAIGKTVTYPLDCDLVFGSKPERDAKLLALSLSALTTPKDRLRHGMFWFMNLTATDAKALALLSQTGNLMEARRIWEQGDQDMSAMQNQMVCCLLMDPRAYATALQDAYDLYADFGDELIATVCGGMQVVTPDQLMPLFLSELVKASDKDSYFWDKAVTRCNDSSLDNLWAEAKALPLIEKLQDALNLAQTTERHTPHDQLDIANRLMTQAEPLLKTLKALSDTHPKLLSRYATIADSVGEEVLDREIAYYNRAVWPPNKRELVMPLMCFSYRYACSARFKVRCQKNINIVLGRKEDARLFPNGKPDNLFTEYGRMKRNEGISAILSALGNHIS